MKKLSILATMVLLFASATLVMAGPGSKGGKMEHRWMMEDSILSSLNLTAEQIDKIRVLRESFQKDIIPLRTQKYERTAELRLLWMQMNVDREKIKAKQKELHNLRWQLQEKATEYRLAFRDILTPEQLSKFLAFGGARDHHYPRGRSARGDDFTRPRHRPRW